MSSEPVSYGEAIRKRGRAEEVRGARAANRGGPYPPRPVGSSNSSGPVWAGERHQAGASM